MSATAEEEVEGALLVAGASQEADVRQVSEGQMPGEVLLVDQVGVEVADPDTAGRAAVARVI
ncbi:hypothetical protein [Streptomyces sp. NPDC046859]|uniref:hypothetical protein n=1 Tax=Streptomyces sp. NPDC046859 TaxID=3155734 RepID=UPI0033ED0506